VNHSTEDTRVEISTRAVDRDGEVSQAAKPVGEARRGGAEPVVLVNEVLAGRSPSTEMRERTSEMQTASTSDRKLLASATTTSSRPFDPLSSIPSKTILRLTGISVFVLVCASMT
jgi:hypothetical protein